MTLTNNRLKTLTLAASITLAAPNAHAQGFDAVRLAPPGKELGTLSAAVIAGYAYRGSDQRRTLVLPLLDYQWGNGWFAGVMNGIGYNFSGSPQMQYGLRLTADPAREERRASALRGMGDVDAALEGGAFFNHSMTQGLIATSSVRYGAGADKNGVVVDLGARYSTSISPNWQLSASTVITFTNAHYMQSFFGVTGAQSAASGYAVYAPGAGARDVRVNLAFTYSIDQKTSITAALSASSLLGDAKDSPLTRKQTSGSGVVAIAYAF